MNPNFSFLLLVIQFMSTITVISGKNITCVEEFRGWVKWRGIRDRCVSTDGFINDCDSCDRHNSKGQYCVKAKTFVPKGMKIPTQDTPGVILNGDCQNYESLTLEGKPYGFGCSTAPDQPQSLFCNAILPETFPSCDHCKQGDKRQPPIIKWN
ncbi:uncharacterized protein MELLADRAFT_123599 [Melampsora larici-populina 98AG31]|uniref:Secreted protein n=1 Tax=Melampsora larici-populina (strain 98AG31 / pathotype 3-4-7) TaxID=747676 RepID=F4S2Q2_MELLP|nr:uncharacterized protein MELLADRAFT_123599 [Melampsora larici-populina 98AG31]EGG01088.1 secreted protein [Melampsora larici-populina 98AG31]